MPSAKAIAEYLDLQLVGDNISVLRAAAMQDVEAQCVVFAKWYSEAFIDHINMTKDVLVIVSHDYDNVKMQCSYIISDNPRLHFLRVVNKFFYAKKEAFIHPTALISEHAKIGINVSIGAYSIIDDEVIIGDNTNIGNHVSITGSVRIGSNCWIKSGAVIGEEGFGFETNEDGALEHFPHIGQITIGNNVFIGANSTIERAALDVTAICDGAAIDDLTQVGHNVFVGKNTWIACGAALCGGVKVGENCSIAPNASVRQRLSIGDGAVIGLGAVVITNVPEGTVYAGNPAKELKQKQS